MVISLAKKINCSIFRYLVKIPSQLQNLLVKSALGAFLNPNPRNNMFTSRRGGVDSSAFLSSEDDFDIRLDREPGSKWSKIADTIKKIVFDIFSSPSVIFFGLTAAITGFLISPIGLSLAGITSAAVIHRLTMACISMSLLTGFEVILRTVGVMVDK